MSVIVAGDMTPSFQVKIADVRAIPEQSRSFLHWCLLAFDDAGARDGRAGVPVFALTDFCALLGQLKTPTVPGPEYHDLAASFVEFPRGLQAASEELERCLPVPQAVQRFQVELSALRLSRIRKAEPRPDPFDVRRGDLMAVRVEGFTPSQGVVSWFQSGRVVRVQAGQDGAVPSVDVVMGPGARAEEDVLAGQGPGGGDAFQARAHPVIPSVQASYWVRQWQWAAVQHLEGLASRGALPPAVNGLTGAAHVVGVYIAACRAGSDSFYLELARCPSFFSLCGYLSVSPITSFVSSGRAF